MISSRNTKNANCLSQPLVSFVRREIKLVAHKNLNNSKSTYISSLELYFLSFFPTQTAPPFTPLRAKTYPRVVDSGNNFHPVGIKQTERSESHRRFLCARLLRVQTRVAIMHVDALKRFTDSFLLLFRDVLCSRIFSVLTRFLDYSVEWF